MSGATATPNLETPPGETPATPPTETPPSETRTPEQIEEARVAALTPEARATEEAAAAEKVAADEKLAARLAPVLADAIKAPEGVEVPPDGWNPLLTVLNDENLTSVERAQKLVNLHVETMKAASEANSKAWEATQEEWKTKFKADAKVGGAAHDASLATMGKLINQFGDDEFRELMDLTGAGNHPAMGRFLVALGAQLTEGGPVVGQTPASTESAARRLFPTMNQ